MDNYRDNFKAVMNSIKAYLQLPDSPESEPALVETLDIVTQCFTKIEIQERIEFSDNVIKKLAFDLSDKKEKTRFDIARSILQTALNRAGV